MMMQPGRKPSLFEYQGKNLTMAEWAYELNISMECFRTRLKKYTDPKLIFVEGRVPLFGFKHKGASNPAFRHGKSGTKIYNAWLALFRRCYDERRWNYQYYGAKGIKVCRRWHIFVNFCSDMGEPPSPKHSIHRLKNNIGYKPTNCVWATPKIQARNRTNSINVTHNGVTLNVEDWAEKLKLSADKIRDRFRKGLPSAEVLAPGNLKSGPRSEK